MKNYKVKTNRKVIKKATKEFVIKYIVSLLLRLIVLVNPILFSKAIDNVTNGLYSTAFIFIYISIALIIFLRLGEILNIYLWHKLHNKLYEEYNSLALECTHDNSLFSLSRINSSEFINIVNNDISIMATFLSNAVIRSIRVIEFFIILGYFYTINFYIGLAGTFVSIVAFIILYTTSKKIDKVNIDKSLEYDRKTNVMIEFFLGIKEIKNFNIFDQVKNRYEKYTSNYTKSLLKQRVVEDALKFGVILLIDIFRLGLIIYAIFLISKGDLTIGVLIIIYNYFAQLIENFGELVTFNINFRQFKVAKLRYYKLIEYSSATDDNYEIRNKELNGLIEFKNVLYGYRDNPILDNVSLKFMPNTINILTGKISGAHSGIFDLLLKSNRQHEGNITIDEIDINNFDHDYYFNNVSLVNKEPTFFNMSIRDNLNIINSNFTRNVEICKDLEIHDDIMMLEDGYDTIISATGAPLNSDLKYFLGIARVLIKKPKIMLFDESFDSFDKYTRTKIINLLKKYKKNHVILIITKEQDFLNIADNIIKFKDNKVAK